jgi:hypothetical protein
MKASQLRSASLLIEQLDAVTADLAYFTKDGDFPHVTVTAKKALKYRPLRGIYKEFLQSRKAAIEALLSKMGVDVSE